MSIDELNAWRRELLGIDLVQDGDDSVPQDEAERRWERFVELADMVVGDEGPTAASTLIAALRADEDHGAHEAVNSALERLAPHDLALGAVMATTDLLTIPPDNSGQVLQLITLVCGPDDLAAFRVAFGQLESDRRNRLAALIAQHERGEWLGDERSIDRLRPPLD